MTDRRIETSRLLRQKMARGSVHYASTPTLAGLDNSQPQQRPPPYDIYDSSSVSNDSTGSNGGYQRLFEGREAYVNRQKAQQKRAHLCTNNNFATSDYSSDYSDNSRTSAEAQSPVNVLSVTPSDVAAIEGAYRGHKTKIFVCRSLANLYTCPKISTMSRTVHNWVLTYTGVPVLLLDTGTTRSRVRRQIQLLLVEKGTCFALWRDIVDNLTRYTCTPDSLFHTFHLSTDHSVRLGLSFDSKEPAQEFYNHLATLTSDPANTGLKGPTVANSKTHYYLDNEPQKSKPARPKFKPNKMDISQPCSFQHVVSVSQSDFQKYFSLQTFVNKSFDEAKQALASGLKRKKAPAPPPPVRQGMTSSISCHNIYTLQH